MPQVDSGMAYETGSAERPKDFNDTNEKGISAKYLIEEYDLAMKRTKDWHADANEIVKRYLSTSTSTNRGKGRHTHNILYSIQKRNVLLYITKNRSRMSEDGLEIKTP